MDYVLVIFGCVYCSITKVLSKQYFFSAFLIVLGIFSTFNIRCLVLNFSICNSGTLKKKEFLWTNLKREISHIF